MFVYLGVEHHSGAPRSKALALIANIRLAWRRLPGTNTLAYYENYGEKSFITLAPGLSTSSLEGWPSRLGLRGDTGTRYFIHNTPFSLQVTNRTNKLDRSITNLEMLARYEHSDLLGQLLSCKESKVL
jgi:hypothetical protein